jgi:hypothetical protein
MQHRGSIRRRVSVGACLTFISSIAVLTVVSSVAADEAGPTGYGYFSI